MALSETAMSQGRRQAAQAHRNAPVEAPPETTPELSWRVLTVLNVFRLLVALLLMSLFYAVDDPRLVGGAYPALFTVVGTVYLLFSIAGVYTLSQHWPPFVYQLYVQIAVDIAALTLLMHASGGIDSGLGNLLVVSVAAASLTVKRRTAGLFAALATISILSEQSVSQLGGLTVPSDYTATGVLGAIIFIIAFAAQPLAKRLRESEALAAQRGVDLENLGELNDYIIQHLRESIVVIDGDDRVRLMNESAAMCLGVEGNARGTHLESISGRLYALVQAWRRDVNARHAQSNSFVARHGSSVITPHFARIGKTEPAAALIFLEDASHLAERVQQSKLAALGRLSASIAHEIRNPVGAMSHAGQLLAESPAVTAEERRLTDIIHNNADRISTIIENVLQLSRRDTTQPEQLTLVTWLDQFVEEFQATHELEPGALSIESADHALEVRMDPSHLQQVLWNLCDNAVEYGVQQEGHVSGEAIVELHTGRLQANGRPFLEVADRGPGIDQQVVERIFEPFVTNTSGGTGLGLFIARQLCECNGAALLYEPRSGGGSCFRIIFADPQRWEI